MEIVKHSIDGDYQITEYSNGCIVKTLKQSELLTETQIPQPYQPTNAEVAQMISDLQADLMIAGVI